MMYFFKNIIFLALVIFFPLHYSMQGGIHFKAELEASCESSCHHSSDIEICQEISKGQNISLDSFNFSEFNSFTHYGVFDSLDFLSLCLVQDDQRKKISRSELARSHLSYSLGENPSFNL